MGQDILLSTKGFIIVSMKCSVGLASLWWLVSKIYAKFFFRILGKTSHTADLEIYYFSVERAIELYWCHVNCLLLNVLSIIATAKNFQDLQYQHKVDLGLVLLLEIAGRIVFKTWFDNLLRTANWFSPIIDFSCPNSWSSWDGSG